MINRLLFNSKLLNMLNNYIDLNKKYFGFSKCKMLKIDKQDIKGIPYICHSNDKIKYLIKIFPCEILKNKDNSFIEIAYLSLFNHELLNPNILPNIPYLYKYYTRIDNNSPCLAHVPYKKIIKKIGDIEEYSNILVCEYFPEQDIDIWVYNNEDVITEDHWKSIIFQVIYSLTILQDKYKFMHNDLHPGNILIDKVTPDIDINYKFYDKSYKVKNLGYIAKLWDFEFSNIFKEEYFNYKNIIEFEVGFNKSYDIHNFLKGLLMIQSLPINTKNFINNLYPKELIYYKNGEINTSNNTDLLVEGILTPKALKQYNLPIPEDLLEHPYFYEYKSEKYNFSKTYVYP